MYLVELFLPLTDNAGAPFSQSHYGAVERELSQRFGGITSYPRAPASGLWKQSEKSAQRDELVVYEVMADKLDIEWWGSYRRQLEQSFRQDRILIRAHVIEVL